MKGLRAKQFANGKMDFVWPQNRPYSAKKHPISNDYDVTQRSLGVGINGKVLECVRKSDRHRFALKVCMLCTIVDVAHLQILIRPIRSCNYN